MNLKRKNSHMINNYYYIFIFGSVKDSNKLIKKYFKNRIGKAKLGNKIYLKLSL